jgi:sugar/nucleoside kinase (ribokinase family)
MARMIHTGQALVDYVLDVPHLPVRGGNVYAGTDRRSAGGSVNILVAATRNGVDAVFAGAHGTGLNGDLIRQTLASECVTVVNPPETDIDSGLCVCLLERDERTFVTTLGAERRITVSALQASRPEPGDVVGVDGYTLVLPQTATPMLTWLGSLPAGVLVVLDPGGGFAEQSEEVRTAATDATTVWTSNLGEAQAYVSISGGTPPASLTAATDAVAALLPHAVVVVRDGPAGCAVHESGVTTLVPGFPRDPVDTNGAGDAHTGILIAGFLGGLTWTQAAVRANLGAAIKVTRLGPATAPSAAEIDAALAS